MRQYSKDKERSETEIFTIICVVNRIEPGVVSPKIRDCNRSLNTKIKLEKHSYQ